jgi:hypothetical protein
MDDRFSNVLSVVVLTVIGLRLVQAVRLSRSRHGRSLAREVPVFGSSDTTAGTFWSWLIPLVFVSLVFIALPLFANAEERMFRSGAQHWSTGKRLLKIVQFGLVHAVIGIPIGVALALSVGGAYFMFVYLRAYRQTYSTSLATLESTRAHTAYNAVIIVTVTVAVVVDAIF